MPIHVVLVSQEPLANGIPVVMERPKAVVTVCSDMAIKKGFDRKLIHFLEKKQIAFRREDKAPDATILDVCVWASDLLNRLEKDFPEEEIILNLTGGNKIMSLGFWEAFKGRALRIIYTDTAHDCIEILAERSGTPPHPIPMGNVLDIPDYLSIQGLDYTGAASDSQEWVKKAVLRTSLTHFLAVRAPDLKGFYSTLDGMAGQNEGTFTKIPAGIWVSALDRIVGAGLAHWKHGIREITFSSQESAHYLGGGWLEEYAYIEARKAGFHDVRSNVKVQSFSDTTPVNNELDVVICHRNRLFILECKTGRLEGNSETKANDIAYKSEVLRQAVGGRFAGTFILSAQETPHGLRERAKSMGITLVGPEELSDLGPILKYSLDRAS